VGHGLGGAIALTLAARYPELVSGLVLVDALFRPDSSEPPRRLASLPIVGGFAFKQVWGRAAFRSYFRDRVFSSENPQPLESIDYYYRRFTPPAARASAFATIRATRDTRPVVADTARIKSRTLVIWGQHDSIYPVAIGHRLARDIRGAGFELMNSGHAPHEEQPEAFARRLKIFLSEL
jgi:pimeloyl-ACP methyl ester carboxylesterase